MILSIPLQVRQAEDKEYSGNATHTPFAISIYLRKARLACSKTVGIFLSLELAAQGPTSCWK